MKKIMLFLLLLGWITHIWAQQSPKITGNNAFKYKSSELTISGMIGESYLNTDTTLSKSLNSIHIGFPYRFVYTQDAFKGDLQASKGYYSDYVRLQWELYNADAVSQIKIYRRNLSETNQDYVFVAAKNAQDNSWRDQYAEPGVMYQYKVIADGIWDTEIMGINRVDGVGFRVTSATVTGRVTYKGGNVVSNVKVVAEPEMASKEGEFSYLFPDSIYGLIRPKYQPNLSEGTSIQAWVKPVIKKGKTEYPVFSLGTSLSFGFKCDEDSVVQIKMGDAEVLSQAIPDSVFREYMQLSLVWNTNTKECQIYLNGDSLLSAKFSDGNVGNSNWLIGGSTQGENNSYFSGYVDEVKLWSKALSEEDVYSSFDAYESPNNQYLAGYWKFNEGGGNNLYDISRKANNFNENHALIVSHSLEYGTYEKVFPSTERLGCKAVTDDNGNYVIAGIPYSSGGSYFRVVPSLGVHRFDPTNKLLYISQESSVFNNIDFTDISSFRVTGRVTYDGTKYFPVSDVYLLVDGTIVSDSKKLPVKTDINGEFEIDVPIGEHYISIEKNGHTFKSAYWPKLDDYNNPTYFDFQDEVYGLKFKDTTKVTLVGKIVGGPIQAGKPTGSKVDPSTNNLGVAQVVLLSERGGVQQIDTIRTDDKSGVYVTNLIPEKFEIKSNPKIVKGSIIFDDDDDLLGIDLTSKFLVQYTVDSVFVDSEENGEIVTAFDYLDTVLSYNHSRDWIYRSTPEISVVSKNDSVYWGDLGYEFKVDEDSTTIIELVTRVNDSVYSYNYDYPVFTQLKHYGLKVQAFEKYENADDADNITIDNVPVTDGVIVVENYLANSNNSESIELNEHGEAVHYFWGGLPLIASPYTKNINFKLQIDGSYVGGAEILQACYLFGAKPSGGVNFVTGPDEVDFVLRDPPGSNSYSYFESGFTTSKTTTKGWGNGFSGDIDVNYMMGVDISFSTGLGFAVETNIESENSIGLSTSHECKWSNENTYSDTKTYSFSYSTSEDANYVGEMGDVFFGNGTNIFYSAANNVRIIKNDSGVYEVGTKKALMVGKQATTDFVYTQNHIENYLIPDLISQRDALFDSAAYVSHLSPNDPNYGLNNNDKVFGGQEVEFAATYNDGPSYKFIFPEGEQSVEDEVKKYNGMIRKWKLILAENELLKLTASDSFDEHNDYNNLSFDAGASIESSISVESTSEQTHTYEWSVDAGVALELGISVNGTGFNTSISEKYHHDSSNSTANSTSQTQTIGFVLADEDQGDYFSVDVKKDIFYGAPVFSLKGGQSACPYEDEEVTRYLTDDFKLDLRAKAGSELAALQIDTTWEELSAIDNFYDEIDAFNLPFYDKNLFWCEDCYDRITDMLERNNIKNKYSWAEWRWELNFMLDEIKYSFYIDPFTKIPVLLVDCIDVYEEMFGTQEQIAAYRDRYKLEKLEPFYTIDYATDQSLSNGTMRIESPELNVEEQVVSNVPEGSLAVFTIKLSNTSDVDADNWFGLFVDPASNPDGAVVQVDGKNLVGGMSVLVPAGKTITKTLTVAKGKDEVNDYEDLAIIMHSLCQFDPTNDIADIADTISIAAHFIPICTKVDITTPLDKWIVNSENKDENNNYTLPVKFGGYDLNHSSFTDFMYQYKPSENSMWLTAQVFVDGAEGEDTTNINSTPTVSYIWNMTGMQNRSYDIRAISHCSDGSVYESDVLTGIYDNVNPTLFGNPQPADGILSPNDDILISFNEEIQAGLLSKANISLTGILNGTDLRDFDYVLHDASLHFDGVTQNMSVAQTINLKYSPFTFEFWAKRERTGTKECLISHGDTDKGGLWIGFDSDDHFVMTLNGATITSEGTFATTGIYNHYVAVFDNSSNIGSNELRLIVASNTETDITTKSVDANYFVSAALTVGYDGVTAFKGNMHDLHIWNQSSTSSEVGARRYTVVSGYEKGLIGAWAMNDAFGTLAKDVAFSRNGKVNATWSISKKGSSLNCNGGYALFESSQMEMTNTSDFSLEFWFKSATPANDEYIFSNGKADASDNSTMKWAIVATASDSLKIMNDGTILRIDGSDYLDNNWHHLALTMNRRGNMTVYLDGESKLSESSSNFTGMGGAKTALGACYYMLNATESTADKMFGGVLDEVRIWNGVRSQELIQKLMNHSLRGDEKGLKAYFPFEDVTVTDPSVNNQTLVNMTTDDNAIGGDCVFNGAASYALETPAIKLAQPIGTIPFNYTVNGNQIIVTPNVDDSYIENTKLDIVIDDIYDTHGNMLESAVAWSAFVDKNQLVWENQEITLECTPDNSPEFTLTVVNKSGSIEYWQIENLPVWLSADMNQGTLDPMASTEITFSVNPAINVGQYNHDIYLNGSMDFNERCTINLSVKDSEPEWEVNPSDYETSMAVIASLKIAGELSTDQDDMVAAFIGSECRGVSKVQYFSARDLYLVNLTIHGAASETSPINLKVWDASKGNLYTNVSTSTSSEQLFDMVFKQNGIIGFPSSPTLIATTDSIGVEIPVKAGWNWLSFNMESNQLDSTNWLMAGVRSATDDEIKINEEPDGEGVFDEYVHPYGWDGKFSGKSFEVAKMYKLNNSFADTIQLSGVPVLTSAYPISLNEEWNWIGYTPQFKMPVSSAMSYHTPTQNDLVKSQSKFAMYDNTLGWIGSLMYMDPNAGYMYYSNNSNATSFVYPQETLFTKSALVKADTNEELSSVNSTCEHNMTAMIRVHNNPVGNLSNTRLVAMVDGRMAGEVHPVGVGGEWYYPLSISAKEKQTISFQLNEIGSDDTYTAEQESVYRSNEILGSVKDPFIISFTSPLGGRVEVAPNPFKDETIISHIPQTVTELVIVDLQGKVIKKWINSETGIISWDGTSQLGNNVPSGVYLLKFIGSDTYEPVKIIKLRD